MSNSIDAGNVYFQDFKSAIIRECCAMHRDGDDQAKYMVGNRPLDG
jgi:hypothetical protein